MSVKLIASMKIRDKELLKELNSNSPEEIIMYCARVSNPENQTSGDPGLLNYCAKQKHWSIFEMSNMVVEIKSSRAIARQILRHRSFSFQETSQRYMKIEEFAKNFIINEARSQDMKNRQNSVDNLGNDDKEWFRKAQIACWNYNQNLYKKALKKGIAKECARVFLPEGITKSTMYMNGSIRSWIHYIDVRCGNGTQKEHMDIAKACKDIFCSEFPNIAEALKWD